MGLQFSKLEWPGTNKRHLSWLTQDHSLAVPSSQPTMAPSRALTALLLLVTLLSGLRLCLAGSVQPRKGAHNQLVLPTDADTHKQTVKDAFMSAYTDWQIYADGSDDLAPQTRSGVNPRNGWGATTVDALGTMKIMGLNVSDKCCPKTIPVLFVASRFH